MTDVDNKKWYKVVIKGKIGSDVPYAKTEYYKASDAGNAWREFCRMHSKSITYEFISVTEYAMQNHSGARGESV